MRFLACGHGVTCSGPPRRTGTFSVCCGYGSGLSPPRLRVGIAWELRMTRTCIPTSESPGRGQRVCEPRGWRAHAGPLALAQRSAALATRGGCLGPASRHPHVTGPGVAVTAQASLVCSCSAPDTPGRLSPWLPARTADHSGPIIVPRLPLV